MNLKYLQFKFRRWWHRIIRQVGKPFTCPLSIGHMLYQGEDKDYWYKVGKDLICSFCGSMHPNQFLQHCKNVIDDNAQHISVNLNDWKTKVYIERPEVRNASEGAIKFKLVHLPEENKKEYIDVINKALKISWTMFMKKLNEEREKLKSNE